MAKPSCRPPAPKSTPSFSRYFKHWRSGKVYDAWDYGHKAWPIGRSR
jgi:hypothetical protein